MRRKIGRNDLIFIAVLAVLVLGIAGIFYLRQGGQGVEVTVTVDGEVYGTYSLSEAQEVPILIDGVTANLLVIAEGKADMTEADCPDKLCVHQRAISKTNETIVCLPNKVVVQVVGSEESGFDSIAK